MAQVSQSNPLSVMIVDDEYMIVSYLERLIRWEELLATCRTGLAMARKPWI